MSEKTEYNIITGILITCAVTFLVSLLLMIWLPIDPAIIAFKMMGTATVVFLSTMLYIANTE